MAVEQKCRGKKTPLNWWPVEEVSVPQRITLHASFVPSSHVFYLPVLEDES